MKLARDTTVLLEDTVAFLTPSDPVAWRHELNEMAGQTYLELLTGMRMHATQQVTQIGTLKSGLGKTGVPLHWLA